MNEALIEQAALAWLAELGFATVSGIDIGPDGSRPERATYGDVVLAGRLRAAIARLNPALDGEARAAVLAKVLQAGTPFLVEENRRLHRYLLEGVPIEVRRADGSIGGEQARLIDFDNEKANDWLAANQITVIENKANRRADVVVYVNGLPLGVLELKKPGDQNATLDGAYNQLQTYKAQIPSLFRTNAVLVISDGLAARIGSLTADRERFMPWRTVAGVDLAPKLRVLCTRWAKLLAGSLEVRLCALQCCLGAGEGRLRVIAARRRIDAPAHQLDGPAGLVARVVACRQRVRHLGLRRLDRGGGSADVLPHLAQPRLGRSHGELVVSRVDPVEQRASLDRRIVVYRHLDDPPAHIGRHADQEGLGGGLGCRRRHPVRDQGIDEEQQRRRDEAQDDAAHRIRPRLRLCGLAHLSAAVRPAARPAFASPGST